MTGIVAFITLDDVGRSLREAFFMFWVTLWPLVLGFALSGAVQAFVSKEQMQRVMGDHRPLAVARATGLGMVSSSCSYAATAMAKSLFQKGADFVTAMVFMFASTNLVIELGVVLLILMGWQFALSEFIGGPVMIVLLALTGGWVMNRRATDAARERLATGSAKAAHDHDAMAGVSDDRQTELERERWSAKLRSKAAWADAAAYTMADLTMLRRELVIGYLIAGALAVLMPADAWNVVFFQGHGAWTVVENVAVGPLIALLSFVCSVGNVPMAAALWKGGISFGGVISFIFADLITFPLLAIYRKYYGTGITVRLLVWFWVVMATAGLLVEGLFSFLGVSPNNRPHEIVATTVEWNYTSFLNLAFLAVAAYLYYLYRHRERYGGGVGYAIDPVCGMQVRIANAPAHARYDGQDYWFCSDHCGERFEKRTGDESSMAAAPADEAEIATIDPVCGMTVRETPETPRAEHGGVTYAFCCEGCRRKFTAHPEEFVPTDAAVARSET